MELSDKTVTMDSTLSGLPSLLTNPLSQISSTDLATLAANSTLGRCASLQISPIEDFSSIQNNGAENTFNSFQPELIALGNDGTFWDSDRSSPDVHFDASGKLLDSPISPPNLFKFNTLNGQAPIVIGHRGGGTGFRPEHTIGDLGGDKIGSDNLGIKFGVDYIEPDLVVTKDNVLIVRHEPVLAAVKTDTNGKVIYDATGKPTIQESTTNVSDLPKFADRLTTKVLDGQSITGWFAEDFTLAEIKELRAVERLPLIRPESTQYNGLFEIPTFDEFIDFAKKSEALTGRKVGIYPETKHPTYFAETGKYLDGTPIHINTSQLLIDDLVANHYTDADHVFIQSFEVSNLKDLKENIMPAAGVNIPLIQLIGSTGAPYDFVYNNDSRTYADLITPFGLSEVATYATGIGPDKRLIVPAAPKLDSNGKPIDINGDGQISDADRFLSQPTALIQNAHNAGLLVHLYTLRSDPYFLAVDYQGEPQREYEQFIGLGIDGYFTDFGNDGVAAKQKAIVDEVCSSTKDRCFIR